MSIKYRIGQLAAKYGYKIIRDYKYPQAHGNLLQVGWSLLKAKTTGPIQVVQIGAFDGLLADPLAQILQDERVTGILVEPQAIPFAALQTRYASNSRIQLVNGVVAGSDGTATLYVPEAGASLKASLNAQHYQNFGVSRANVREIQVTAFSVASLLKQYARHRVNVLQIDTEGMDLEILRWFFAAGEQPEVINFESFHLGKVDRAASRELLGKDYWWFETEQDTFAIKESLLTTG